MADRHGPLGDHRYRLIAFDWDGTAVTDRSEHPAELARAMQRLLDAGVLLVVITGTNADNVGGQIAPLLTPSALSRLYLMVNRGSEVYAHEADGSRSLLWAREASSEENAALDRTADAVRDTLAAEYGIEIDIVRNRLNRRKLDLIPTPEWADPPKSRIGELLAAVDERLKAIPGGIGAVIDMTVDAAKEAGLRDPRITTDVKHVEVGLTDKSDSIGYVMRRLAPARAILPREVLLAGDEFGPIAGFEGSDYRMVSRLAAGATIVSVGREPNGVPSGVLQLGGGPAAFVELLDAQADLGRLPAPAPPAEAEEAVAPPPPPDGWVVERTGYDPVHESSAEALFALSNGFMGIRGTADEDGPGSMPGAYVGGLYDGTVAGQEDLVVIGDWASSEIVVAGRPFRPWEWKVVEHTRRLDLRALRLERTLRCVDPDGRTLRLRSQRIASLADRHVGAIRLELLLESGPDAHVEVVSAVQTREAHRPLPHVQLVATGSVGEIAVLHSRTPGNRVAVDHAIAVSASARSSALACEHVTTEDMCGRAVSCDLVAGDELVIDRFVAVYTEREAPLPGPAAVRATRKAQNAGFDELLEAHAAAWGQVWDVADVEIEGDQDAQLGVRFAAAQLIAAAPAEGSRSSIGAKGLTGDGYKGHVFWDTDIFQLPFFAAVRPEIARRIVEYRVLTLDAARRNAENAGLRGAWYAWESAASGEDVTPSFVVGPGGRRLEVLTGHQEIHVVADVAWAIETYVRTSGDEAFLDAGGGEVTAEAARFFLSRAVETPRGLEIHDVIGPDELHEHVSNSGFTNAMAAWTLRRAADLADAGHAPATPEEAKEWRQAADRMLILRTADGVIEEHEGFMELPLPPDERAGRDELAWQRDRMEWRDVKQADVVMLMALLEPQFSEAERVASYRLYEPLTRHLSSLSEAVHSLVARRTGMDDEADDYLRRATAIDLDDSRGNRAEGLHMATQGGLWQAVVLGAAGARALDDGSFRLDPHLPPHWERLRFRWIHRGTPLTVTVSADELVVEAAEGTAAITAPGWSGEVRAGEPLRLARDSRGWRAAA
ncbi:MAG TPA: glycosyl hydrolase family 65 protein [Gaiellales bacterium]